MIHQPLSPDQVHPQNQFVREIVIPLPCLSVLVRHTLLFVCLLLQSIHLFIGSLDKCHTSVFNALIYLSRWIQLCDKKKSDIR